MVSNRPLRLTSLRVLRSWPRVAAVILLAAAVIAGLPGEALAQGAAEPDEWHFAGDVQTDFPVDVAFRMQLEMPFRVRLATSIGVMPGPYVDAINTFLVGVNAYDADTAALVKTALDASLVWRTHAGYRPLRDHGLYLEAGYGLVTLGGGASAAELVAGVTGRTLPPSQGKLNFNVRSTLHMADVEIGWEWTIVKYLHVRAAAGGAFTFAAQTVVKNDSDLSGRAMESFEEGSASYLDSLYRSYVFTPVVTLGVGGQAF